MLPSCHRQSRRHKSTSTTGAFLRSFNWVLAALALWETVALSGVGMMYLVSCKRKQILSINIDKKTRIMLNKRHSFLSLCFFTEGAGHGKAPAPWAVTTTWPANTWKRQVWSSRLRDGGTTAMCMRNLAPLHSQEAATLLFTLLLG